MKAPEERNNEEHCASLPSDVKSDKYDENAQLYVTLLTVRYSIQPLSIPAHPALAPEWNVAFRVLNNETGVEERWEVALLPLKIALHREPQDISQVDM